MDQFHFSWMIIETYELLVVVWGFVSKCSIRREIEECVVRLRSVKKSHCLMMKSFASLKFQVTFCWFMIEDVGRWQ